MIDTNLNLLSHISKTIPMKKKPFYAQIKDLFFGLSLIALIVSCGSFKGSSSVSYTHLTLPTKA